MTLGSLFDGSGGFPLGAMLCGITPVWAAEVEPYPIKVTKTRIPFMKHLGNVTETDGAKIEPVDIITFGSPCQDLSIAGKREGLHGNRSGLFHEAMRIVKEMRIATNGECEELYACGLCRDIFAFWLDEEYEEPPKPEVDWSKVPVDTLVRVRDREDREWILRYFKGINDGNAMCRYSAWEAGATSKTAEGDYTLWKYCELVEDEDNDK